MDYRKEDIVKTHNLSEGQFAVVPQTIGDGGARQVYYRVIAPASEPKRYLGHLRYAAQDGEGVVELVTKGVRLDLGGEESASRGGAPESKIPYESLETAILVLMSSPQNNRVRIRTGLFDWRFNFNKQASLVAVRQRFPPGEARDIQRQILESGATCDSESSEAWPGKDTQLIFGEPGKAHDEHGNPTTRAQVTEHDFESWTKTALFLQDMPEDARIHTLNGDIILLPALAGRLYYDELLLHSRDSSKHRKKPLKYAYNFPRRSPFIKDDLVLSSDAQAKAIMAIWNRAISLHPKLVKQLSDMLSDAEVEFDDVVGAEAYLAQKPASLLRKHLLMYSPGNVWFYSPQEKAMVWAILFCCFGRSLDRTTTLFFAASTVHRIPRLFPAPFEPAYARLCRSLTISGSRFTCENPKRKVCGQGADTSAVGHHGQVCTLDHGRPRPSQACATNAAPPGPSPLRSG